MARGFSASEIRITAGPVAGLVAREVATKIMEQRTKFGAKYEELARQRQGWPSALTRELELRRALAVDPNAKFPDERNDPTATFNQVRVETMIWDMPVEVGVVYDKYNRLISMTMGEAERVKADALRSQFEGGTFIHNHPGGGPFSSGDLRSYFHYSPAEIIALSNEGRYSLKGMPKGASPDVLAVIVPKKVDEVQYGAMPKVGSFAVAAIMGELDAKTKRAIADAPTWQELENRLPEPQRSKFSSIVNKNIGIATNKALAKMGFEVKFSPTANPKGYSSYDEIPTLKTK